MWSALRRKCVNQETVQQVPSKGRSLSKVRLEGVGHCGRGVLEF